MDEIQGVKDAVGDMHRDYAKQQSDTTAQLLKATTTLERILKAFPDEDPEGHCRYHLEVIEEIKERKRVWMEIRTHLLKGTAWGLLLGVGLGLWALLKYKLGAFGAP